MCLFLRWRVIGVLCLFSAGLVAGCGGKAQSIQSSDAAGDASLIQSSDAITDASLAQAAASDASSAPSSDAASNSLTPCDPLARRPVHIAAGAAVAQDAQETLYVAEEPSSALSRVFVSHAGTLYERHVSGSGGGPSKCTLSYDDVDGLGIAPHALLTQTSDGTTSAMALASYGSRIFIGDANASYQMLQLVNATSIANMKALGLPDEVTYVGTMDNSQQVVIATSVGNSQSGYRVFYGSRDNMAERTIMSVTTDGVLSAPMQVVNFVVGSTQKQVVLGGAETQNYPVDAGLSDAGVERGSFD